MATTGRRRGARSSCGFLPRISPTENSPQDARSLQVARPALPAFFAGSEKLRPVEKPVRPFEHRDERRAVGRMRDMDVAARSPHEVTRAATAFRVLQRSFEHKS